MYNFFNEKLFLFSGPRIRLPLFGAMTGVLRHQHLLIDLAVIATVLVAHVDDLREMIGIGIETGTEIGIAMIVIERGEADPPKGIAEVQVPIAEGTTATAPEPLQLKITKRMIEKKIGLKPLPMIIKVTLSSFSYAMPSYFDFVCLGLVLFFSKIRAPLALLPKLFIKSDD